VASTGVPLPGPTSPARPRGSQAGCRALRLTSPRPSPAFRSRRPPRRPTRRLCSSWRGSPCARRARPRPGRRAARPGSARSPRSASLPHDSRLTPPPLRAHAPALPSHRPAARRRRRSRRRRRRAARRRSASRGRRRTRAYPHRARGERGCQLPRRPVLLRLTRRLPAPPLPARAARTSTRCSSRCTPRSASPRRACPS
jgi:hypothetical protein